MTRTTATKRRIIAAASAVAALALLGGSIPAASATVDTTSAAQTAKVRSAKDAKATKANAAARAARAAAAASDYSSIFATQSPALANAGWSSCSSPIAWTVDASELSAAETAAQVANIEAAFTEWTKASGLTFRYAGTQELTYNDDAFTLKPADGSAIEQRHIYLAFVADSDSGRLGGGVVGLGSPSQVWQSTKEIVAGTAVFRTDHVTGASDSEDTSLYLHELGHVLGLAHAAETANIMYPVVTDHTSVGTGDTNGVRSMTKPCAQAA